MCAVVCVVSSWYPRTVDQCTTTLSSEVSTEQALNIKEEREVLMLSKGTSVYPRTAPSYNCNVDNIDDMSETGGPTYSP